MPLERLDHVNLRTGRLEVMVGFYRRVLGMESGWRPAFPFGGAWLYLGDSPVVHLVEVETTPETRAPRIEHFAFRASGLPGFLARLDDAGVPYRFGRPPGAGIVQVNLEDPDGNHLHIDFPEAEAADLPA